MTPICPKCGSVKVKGGECLEDDCGHKGHADSFRPHNQRPEGIRAPRSHWRDPVAMSMDGYEGE